MASNLCPQCILYDIKKYLATPAEKKAKKDEDKEEEPRRSAARRRLLRPFHDFLEHPECPFCRLIAKTVRSSTGSDVPLEAHCYLKPMNAFILRDTGRQWTGVDYLELRFTAWRDDPFDVGDMANHKYIDFLIRPMDMSESRKEVLHSRPVGDLVDIGLIRSWLDLCWKDHRKLEHHHFSAGGDSYVPKAPKIDVDLLVIDVKKKHISALPDSSTWATLSYVWGPPEIAQLKTLQENKQEIFRSGSLTRMWGKVPTTVKDAMTLCEKLGVRYLWVDALCIVQNDEVNMAKSIAAMGDIYSNSAFTIVAASGTDSWAGIPGIQPGTRKVCQHMEVVDGLNVTNALPDFETAIARSTWNKRGWTFQEKLLSSILILFTERQVFFHCNHSLLTEDLITELPLSKEIEYITMSDPGPSHDHNILRALHKQSLTSEQAYHKLTGDLNGRLMFKESDRLNAFAGLSKYLEKRYQLHFWQGLPFEYFDAYILFDVTDNKSSRPGFPSWSWAGWMPAYPFAIPRERDVGLHILVNEVEWYNCACEEGIWKLRPFKYHGVKELATDEAENLIRLLEDVAPEIKSESEAADLAALALSSPCPFPLPSRFMPSQYLRGWSQMEIARVKQSIANYTDGKGSATELKLSDKERKAVSRIIQCWMAGVSDQTIAFITGIEISRPKISTDTWTLALLRSHWKGSPLETSPSLPLPLPLKGLSPTQLGSLLVFQTSCAKVTMHIVDPRPPYTPLHVDIYEANMPAWETAHARLRAGGGISSGSLPSAPTSPGREPITYKLRINNKSYAAASSRTFEFIVIARRKAAGQGRGGGGSVIRLLQQQSHGQQHMAYSTLELMAIATDDKSKISRRVDVELMRMSDAAWADFNPVWRTVYLL